MANSQSVVVTGVVAMVLGIVVGVVGLAAATKYQSPTAQDVAQHTNSDDLQPRVYGSR